MYKIVPFPSFQNFDNPSLPSPILSWYWSSVHLLCFENSCTSNQAGDRLQWIEIKENSDTAYYLWLSTHLARQYQRTGFAHCLLEPFLPLRIYIYISILECENNINKKSVNTQIETYFLNFRIKPKKERDDSMIRTIACPHKGCSKMFR